MSPFRRKIERGRAESGGEFQNDVGQIDVFNQVVVLVVMVGVPLSGGVDPLACGGLEGPLAGMALNPEVGGVSHCPCPQLRIVHQVVRNVRSSEEVRVCIGGIIQQPRGVTEGHLGGVTEEGPIAFSNADVVVVRQAKPDFVDAGCFKEALQAVILSLGIDHQEVGLNLVPANLLVVFQVCRLMVSSWEA